MKIKLSAVGIAAVRLLEAVNASADAFPPLKSASGGALHLGRLIEVGRHCHLSRLAVIVSNSRRDFARTRKTGPDSSSTSRRVLR